MKRLSLVLILCLAGPADAASPSLAAARIRLSRSGVEKACDELRFPLGDPVKAAYFLDSTRIELDQAEEALGSAEDQERLARMRKTIKGIAREIESNRGKILDRLLVFEGELDRFLRELKERVSSDKP